MGEAVQSNISFLEQLEGIMKITDLPVYKQTADGLRGSKSVQNLLQMFTREWSAEGASERKECHEKLINALQDHLKEKEGKKIVLPGAGLGRLAFEVKELG